MILGILLLGGCVTKPTVTESRFMELIASQKVENDTEYGDGWNQSLKTLEHQLEGNK